MTVFCEIIPTALIRIVTNLRRSRHRYPIAHCNIRLLHHHLEKLWTGPKDSMYVLPHSVRCLSLNNRPSGTQSGSRLLWTESPTCSKHESQPHEYQLNTHDPHGSRLHPTLYATQASKIDSNGLSPSPPPHTPSSIAHQTIHSFDTTLSNSPTPRAAFLYVTYTTTLRSSLLDKETLCVAGDARPSLTLFSYWRIAPWFLVRLFDYMYLYFGHQFVTSFSHPQDLN